MRTLYTYFLLLSLSYSKYITSQFFKNVNSFQMPIFMGTPPKKVNLEIDMAIDYTWTTSFLYPDKSLTKQILPNEDRLSFSNRRTAHYISTFYSSPFEQYDDYDCIIGYRFINAFNYTVFDYEAKSVKFYSDTIHIEMLSNMPIELMCLFSSVIMLYAIILLLFAHNK